MKKKHLLSGYEIWALKDCCTPRTVRELRQPEDSEQLCLSVLCNSRGPGVSQQMGRTQCHLVLCGGYGGILVLLAEILAQSACSAHPLRGQQCCLLGGITFYEQLQFSAVKCILRKQGSCRCWWRLTEGRCKASIPVSSQSL